MATERNAGWITAAYLAVVLLAILLSGDRTALAQQGLPSLPPAGGSTTGSQVQPAQSSSSGQFAPPPPAYTTTPQPPASQAATQQTKPLAPQLPAAGATPPATGVPSLPAAGAAPASATPPVTSPPDSAAKAPAPAPSQPWAPGPVPAPVDGFDVVAERAVADVYPPELNESGQHTLGEPVKPGPSPSVLGLWNRTSVQSAFGAVEAANESFAKIRIREVEAIAKLKAIDTGETVTGGMANAAMAPIRAVGAILTSPVETVKNIPKGVGDFVGRTSEGFKSDKSKFEDGMFAEIAGVSRKKRELAAQMGVDVYSSNQLLQTELDRVGKASAAGNITVDVGMIAVTGTAGAVISNLGRVDALQEIVNTQPASELRRRSRFTLEQMGMPSSFIDKFLDHPYYSPRRKTIIAGLLSPLKETKGREKFMEAALTAESEEAALYYQQMLEIISSFHFGVAPVAEIVLVEGMPVALSEQSGAFVALPTDRMYWTKDAPDAANKLVAGILAVKRVPVTLWTLGDMTPGTAHEFGRRGVQLGQRVQLNYN